ncbi:hypothetical protein FXF61_02925 [Pseudomonas sp. C27(2019)]|uniref:hypothetical protein n=1 Tax=Pseudomonas sp. C27(2019) TaxID=2604941 RepID=UPI001244D3C6|nr:hypothetical protein [Pseudomonas sp. C27(2019)]QEY58198.1 hypothetical protein FXF61_02925 [Pseudomonas sp. C27(2019)]
MSLLDRLTNRGDLVALHRGRLIIQPASGAAVPQDWLKNHNDELATALATRANISLYKYTGYTAGSYTEYKADGVTLRFINLATSEDAYAVFNVNRSRAQTTARGKAGSKLTGNRFRITRNMALYKFWMRSGLPEPKSKYLSEFHRVMGRLKSVYFTMVVSDGKADKNTIQGLTIIENDGELVRGKVGDKAGNQVGEKGGRLAGIEIPPNLYDTRATDDFNYVSNVVRLKLTRRHVGKSPSHPNNTLSTAQTNTIHNEKTSVAPQDQSVEEWLADYDS